MNSATKAATVVYRQLLDAERAIDEALISVGTLAAQLPKARQDIGIAVQFGQQAMNDIAATLQTITAARDLIGRTHDGLADVRDELGVQVTAVGVGAPKPSWPKVTPIGVKKVA